jgi:hypothetical protein
MLVIAIFPLHLLVKRRKLPIHEFDETHILPIHYFDETDILPVHVNRCRQRFRFWFRRAA